MSLDRWKSIRASLGVRGEEILEGEGGRGKRDRKSYFAVLTISSISSHPPWVSG